MTAAVTLVAIMVMLAGSVTGASADAEVAWNALIEGNQRFAAGLVRDRHLVPARNAVIAGAHPRAIVLGCSDSRVSPELLFDQGLGDLWVVRTAGNDPDPGAEASIDHAVDALGVDLVIVLGHDGCDFAANIEVAVNRAATDVAARSETVRRALAAGRLVIIRAVYDPGSGIVRRIP